MRRKNHLKMPNGFGTIQYLGDNRRNSYGARKTIGWDENGKQIRPYVGYAKDWNSAYEILLQYNNMPFDLGFKNTTIGEVYNILEPILLKSYQNEEMSESNYKNMISVYKNHLIKIENKKIMELKKKEVQKVIDESGLKYTGRDYIKNIFTRIIDYSVEELGLSVDAKLTDLNVGKKEKSTKHIPFTDKEIEILKTLPKTKLIVKLIMIFLYTGMRPNEGLNIETTNVFIDKGYMIGGSKTEAGRNRIIPIHSDIKQFIIELYDTNNKYLIVNENTKQKMSYDTYQKMFDALMQNLNLDHTPYDTRHTFATKCAKAGINDVIIKIIIGHSLANDVTNNIYIHRDVEMLRKEIEKIKY